MSFDSRGIFTPDTVDDIRSLIEAALRTQFGDDYDLGAGSPLMKFGEAFVGTPLALLQSDMLEVMRQAFPATATGDNLDRLLFIGSRAQAARSMGVINVVFLTTLATPPEPDPFFPAQTLVFIDKSGRQYENTEDVSVDGTNAVAIAVQALELGDSGNIDVNSISQVTFRNNTVSTRWATNVNTFTNDALFTGGADQETDSEFLTRFRVQLASKPESSLDGLVNAVGPTGVDGVTSASGVENVEMVSSADEKTLDGSTHVGTASETIDATNTRIARKFTVGVTARRFIQDFAIKLAANTALVGTVRIETDTAGSPSGTLAHVNLEETGFTPVTTTRTVGHFDDGAFLTSGDYWMVFTRTSGSGTFDGATGGTAGDVKVYDGSWSNDANVNKLAVEVIHGVPPKAVRLYVNGGDVDEIAQAIHEARAAGVYMDGDTTGIAAPSQGGTLVYRFQRPTIVQLYVEVTVQTDSGWDGTEDDIRDIVVEYIGGTDSNGTIHPGLDVSEKFIFNEMISRILDESRVSGTYNITNLDVDTVDPPVAETDLTPTPGQKFEVLLANIDVVLVAI